jgi:hypothetical protein
MSEGTENNNVYDFAAKGQQDYADAMLEALQSYIEGEVEVRFIEGETYIVPKEDIVEATEKKNV